MKVLAALVLLAGSAMFAQTDAEARKPRMRSPEHTRVDPNEPMENCGAQPLDLSATLGEAFKAACISPEASDDARLDLRTAISNYAVLNTKREFVIAYYDVPGEDNLLKAPLHVVRYLRPSNLWQHSDLLGSEAPASVFRASCVGTALSIHRAGPFLAVMTHLTPSASCMLVLGDELKLRDTRYGWYLVGVGSTIVYEHSTIHFAPTRPMVLSLYDPASGADTPFYPSSTDPLRAEYIRRLRQIDPSERCSGPNCSIFPEQFESTLLKIVSNSRTHSLAFLAAFTPEGFVSGDKVKESGITRHVLYVYLLLDSKAEMREFPEEEIKSRFGTENLNDLLKPEMLQRVFAQ